MVSAFTHEKCAAVVSRYSAYAADDSAADDDDDDDTSARIEAYGFSLIHETQICAPQSGINETPLQRSAKWELVWADEENIAAENESNDELYEKYVLRAIEECTNTPGCRYLNVFPDGRYELLADADCEAFRAPRDVYPSSGYSSFARAYKFSYEYNPLVKTPHEWFEMKKTADDSHKAKCVGTVLYESSSVIDSKSTQEEALSLLRANVYDTRVTDRGIRADNNLLSDALFGELSRRAAFRCLAVATCNAFNVKTNGKYELLSSCDSVVPASIARAFQRNFSVESAIEAGIADDFEMVKRPNGAWNTYCTGADPLYDSPNGALSQASDLDETQITVTNHPNDTLFFEYTKRAVRKCRENHDCGYVSTFTSGRYKLWPKTKPFEECTPSHGSARTYALRSDIAQLAGSIYDGEYKILENQASCTGQPFRVLKKWRLLSGGEPNVAAPYRVPRRNALMYLWAQRGAQACADTPGCKYFSVNTTAGLSMYDEGECDSFVENKMERVHAVSGKDDELGEVVSDGFFKLVKHSSGEWGGKCVPSGPYPSLSALKIGPVGALFSEVELNYTLTNGRVSASPKSRFFADLAERAANTCLFTPGCEFFNVYTNGKYELYRKGTCHDEANRASSNRSRMYEITFDVSAMAKVPNLMLVLLENTGAASTPEANACDVSDKPYFSSRTWALLGPLDEPVEATGDLDDFRFFGFTQSATEICANDPKCAYVSVKTDASYKMFKSSRCQTLTPSANSRVFKKFTP
jgi:hypothetical protein